MVCSRVDRRNSETILSVPGVTPECEVSHIQFGKQALRSKEPGVSQITCFVTRGASG
jgi:peroxiredoxin